MSLPGQDDSKFWLVLLRELDLAGGAAKPQAVYPRIRGYFPEIADADVAEMLKSGGNRWTNRIQFVRQRLVDCGCIDSSTYGVWVLTPHGKEWLDQHWQGPSADYSGVIKPPVLPKKKVDGPKPPSSATNPPSLLVVPDSVGQLSANLRKCQRLSTTPVAFEKAVAAAFESLGFEAKHVGGSGDTDVFVTAPLGQASYAIVVDAKSNSGGKVPDSQISWPVIEQHRQKAGASFAAVVAEEFSGGQLQRFADQFNVTLITTEMLCSLLALHAATPFSLLELKETFSAPGRAEASVQALKVRHQHHVRHWKLLGEIVETMDRFQRQMPAGLAPNVGQPASSSAARQ